MMMIWALTLSQKLTMKTPIRFANFWQAQLSCLTSCHSLSLTKRNWQPLEELNEHEQCRHRETKMSISVKQAQRGRVGVRGVQSLAQAEMSLTSGCGMACCPCTAYAWNKWEHNNHRPCIGRRLKLIKKDQQQQVPSKSPHFLQRKHL